MFFITFYLIIEFHFCKNIVFIYALLHGNLVSLLILKVLFHEKQTAAKNSKCIMESINISIIFYEIYVTFSFFKSWLLYVPHLIHIWA